MFDRRSVHRRDDAPLPNSCALQAPHAGIPDHRTLAQRRNSRCFEQTATRARCKVSVPDSIREPEAVMHEQVNEIFTCGTRCLCGPITIDVGFIQRARSEYKLGGAY
jgi:hypothetical protein